MSDKEYREYIINHLDSNIFVLAGAGSGKTTILVDRMVALVEEKDDIISKICAITFTKNAATHFLAKFEEKLRERSEMTRDEWIKDTTTHLKEPTDLSRSRCKKALENINQSFAGTIDAFCNLIISEHPLEAKVPSSASVVDEAEFPSIYKKEYKAISDRKAPYTDLSNKLDCFIRLHKNPGDVFAKSIMEIMESLALDIEFESPSITLEQAFYNLKNQYQEDILDDINYIKTHENDLVNDSKVNEAYRKFMGIYKNKTDFTIKDIGNLKYFIRNVSPLRFESDPEFKFIPYYFMKKNKVYAIDEKKIKEEDSIAYSFTKDLCEIIYQYSMDFLIAAAKEIRLKLRGEGKLSFTEYLLCFKEMLLEDMENTDMPLIKHIRNRHSIFLLDESQDTSPIQTEVFMLLSSSVPAKSKHEAKPIPGSLFIVGDPKQSIYRFKGADIMAYNDTKEMFSLHDEDNSLAILSNNFRSTNLLCKYFNDTFERVLPFFYHIPEKSDYDSKDITTGIYSYSDYANVIKALVDKDSKYKKVVKGDLSNIEYKDIMLITRTTTNHQRVIDKLKEEGIPVFVEGKFFIKGNEALESIYAVYAYISYETIEYKLNLLASPLFKLKDLDLKGEIKSNLFDLIEELRINKYKFNPVSLYQEIINKLKLFLYVSKENMEYVYFVLETLKKEYSQGNISDYIIASSFLSDFILKVIDRVPYLKEEPNAIHLANIHKVKGLEAPVVILIESTKRPMAPTVYQDYINGKSYIIRCARNDLGNGVTYSIETKNYKEYEEIENRLEEEEELRLKYVAATRAMNFLFIPKNTKLWSELGSHEQFIEEDIPSSITSNKDSIYLESNITFNDTPTYNIKRPSDDHLDIEVIKDQEIPNKNPIPATIKGTLIHNMMELLVRSNFTYEKKDLILATLDKNNLGGRDLYLMLEDIYDTLFTKGGYKQYMDKYPSDIISILKSADELHPEYPFSYMEDKDIIYGLIDLLYVKDNKVYIIDYKTNYEPEGHQGEVDWEDIYKGQLKSYKEAIEKLYHMDVETHIYHIG